MSSSNSNSNSNSDGKNKNSDFGNPKSKLGMLGIDLLSDSSVGSAQSGNQLNAAATAAAGKPLTSVDCYIYYIVCMNSH